MNVQSKMLAVAGEFGLNLGQQGSTGNFFQDLPVVAGQTQYSFFDTLGLSLPQRRNLTDNKFPINQAAVIEFLSFQVYRVETEGVTELVLDTYNTLGGSRFNVFIGNTNVVKDALYVPNNADGYPGVAVPGVIALESPLVIPPLSTFKITLDLRSALDPLAVSFVGVQFIGRVAYPSGTY